MDLPASPVDSYRTVNTIYMENSIVPHSWNAANFLIISREFVVVVLGAENTWAVVTLFLLGKMGITSAFSTSYVHTSEMLPTIIRSIGVGAASTVARIGALIAPFVPLLVSSCNFQTEKCISTPLEHYTYILICVRCICFTE